MGKVLGGMAMSLDGFVNDSNGSVALLYANFEAFINTDYMQEQMKSTGAVVMGRKTYDMGNGDYTGYEYQVSIFVVTHKPPKKAAKGQNSKLKFSFVTDGLESAVAQAKTAAGDKDVTVVGGASTIQQLLKAKLLDELHITVVPILLNEGLRLFDKLGDHPPRLERLKLIESPAGRTDIIYRVVK
ncbi:MAG: dihydrofolate reductase family protein [Chloroflexi bacterium]|nr:dihydrofolate reductase family protein [Chloroflexota bacterium]MCC6894902.1 dihydrofolate reductase [Anaerolineae bacterium]